MSQGKTKEQMVFELVKQFNNMEERLLGLFLGASDTKRAELFESLQENFKGFSKRFNPNLEDCPKGQHRNEFGDCVDD